MNEIINYTQRRKVKVINDDERLTMRSATFLVGVANEFANCDIVIDYKGKNANAKSIKEVSGLLIRNDLDFDIWVQSNNMDTTERVIEKIVQKLIEKGIVEEVYMGETDIELEVAESFNYLKRFDKEELLQIIGGTLHKCCELDGYDYNELIDLLKDI